jgi:hypothetical protein
MYGLFWPLNFLSFFFSCSSNIYIYIYIFVTNIALKTRETYNPSRGKKTSGGPKPLQTEEGEEGGGKVEMQPE